jgi:hypothetical protein
MLEGMWQLADSAGIWLIQRNIGRRRCVNSSGYRYPGAVISVRRSIVGTGAS